MIRVAPLDFSSWILPPLALISPMTSPIKASSTRISTATIGSNNWGLPFWRPSLHAMDAATLKARWLASDSRYIASTRAVDTSTTGYPRTTPLSIDSVTPCSTAETNSPGNRSSDKAFVKRFPEPRSRGESSRTT